MKTLNTIAQEIAKCTACPLHKNRINTVPGSGNTNADIIIIGEAPGAKEDKEGLPFMGAAGKILTQALEQAQMSREDVFITNTVKCRPPENRDPSKEEKAACAPFLKQQIDLIKPKIFLLLGKHSLQSAFPDANITQSRGQLKIKDGIHYFITFHPAATIYNQKLRPQLFEDLKTLAKIIKK